MIYVDDVLVVSEYSEIILREEIVKYFEMKDKSIGTPSIYLGGEVNNIEMNNGVEAWSISSSQYVQTAVDDVETYFQEKVIKLVSKTDRLLSSNYCPELDVTE